MTSLAEREGFKGKVQMIYIDPPYGIKFGSNWQVSTRKRDVKDGAVKDATRQPEQVKAFRDTWELGIHSYLTYLRDRLVTARELLAESGSVFVQIGDENVHLVRCLMDEVFGSENFVAEISYGTSTGRTAKHLDCVLDKILWYGKNTESLKFRQLFFDKTENDANENGLKDEFGEFRLGDLSSQHPSVTRSVPFIFRGKEYTPPMGRQWGCDPTDGLRRVAMADRIFRFSNKQIRLKKYESEFPVSKVKNIWLDVQFGAFNSNKIYVVQTSDKIISRCVQMTTDPGDLVLDPTCGSGATAYMSEQWGRRWITIDTSRVALALARTRLMSAKYPYYLLTDSQAGMDKETVVTGIKPPPYKTAHDVRKGFVYKRVPHVTLKSIANNVEIDDIYDKWLKRMEPVRKDLNKASGEKWEEWEIPRESDNSWSAEAKNLHEKWWDLRRKRQKEIDDSIAKKADTELLYDQPYEDNRRIRVTGPFTVESLSPHRRLTIQEQKQFEKQVGVELTFRGASSFAQKILDNLKKSGAQFYYKDERLKFDRLEVFAGEYIQGEGDFTDSDGKQKSVAVCIGPEYGTVDPDLIRDAAKEAMKGVGFDVLLVCGFSFDPHISKEKRDYGKLTVLPTRMNSDLSMGDELLKKTGAGNLFMIFGEPDIDIRSKDGQVEVEIKGLDVYDPTTGEVRASSTDEIACWFIDTDYNDESFFVRHAYFTGEGEPYKKLQRALRSEINEDAWESLYSTVSRPFDKPKSGKIAIKVINHFGDEVLQVYEVK